MQSANQSLVQFQLTCVLRTHCAFASNMFSVCRNIYSTPPRKLSEEIHICNLTFIFLLPYLVGPTFSNIRVVHLTRTSILKTNKIGYFRATWKICKINDGNDNQGLIGKSDTANDTRTISRNAFCIVGEILRFATLSRRFDNVLHPTSSPMGSIAGFC